MSDLVERLRSLARFSSGFSRTVTARTCLDAAAEIERLEARIAMLEAQLQEGLNGAESEDTGSL